MADTKRHPRQEAHNEEHRAWELEVQTEGLDELQGERLEKETKKKTLRRKKY